LALEALHGKTVSTRVIPITEDEALDRDVDEAQERPSIDDYSAIPVAEFGAALLRGMGWKDTETISNDATKSSMKPRVFERRPALLGVGAKPSKSIGVEIGEWGKADHKKKKVVYTPVILKNKTTGEVMTEAEFKSQTDKQTSTSTEMVFEKPKESEDRSKDDRKNRDYDRKDRHRKERDSNKKYDHDDRDDYKKSERRDRSKYDYEDKDQYRSSDRHRKDKERRDDSRYDDRKDRDRRSDYKESSSRRHLD
jgi:hypothetical protein